MADFGKVDHNLGILVRKDAAPDVIDAYLRSEGVTWDQVKAYRDQQKGGNMLTRAASGIWDMVKNKPDPNFADLPSIAEKSPTFNMSAGWAKATGATDEGLADIAKRDLGDRYIRTDRDANNFPIMVYRGEDGSEQKAYVNKPVWDWQDLDRGIQGALPFVVTGGLTGAATKALGPLLRMGAQGVAGATTSVGQDFAAMGMGSEQGVSGTKALAAGAGGAIGEGIGMWIGSIMRNRAAQRELLDASGKLTSTGREAARRAGLDPDTVDAELAKQINAELRFAKDPYEAVSGVTTDRMGIPTTLGQRTDDPAQVLIEKDMRMGTLGPKARDRIKAFDEQQNAAINRLVSPNEFGDGRFMVKPGENNIPSRLNPNRIFYGDTGEMDAGQTIKSAFEISRKSADDLESAAWSRVGDIRPKAEAFETLPSFVQRNMPFQVAENLHPATTEMLRRLSAYMKGDAVAPPVPDILGPPRRMTLDQMRRELLGLRNAAKDSSDGAAAKAVYDSFNDWIDDSAERALVQGDAASARALRSARATTREVRGMFSPTDARGLKAPAARILERMATADTPEGAISALLGGKGAGARGALPNGHVEALTRYREILNRFAPDQAADAWNDIRLTYWMRLVSGKNGDVLGPQALRSNILASLRGRPSLMNTLYSVEEQQLMTRVANALKTATYKDPNPSGSGTAVRALMPQITGDLAKGMQARARMQAVSGKASGVLMSRIWGVLAKRLPEILEQGVAGNSVANRALSQNIARRPLPVRGQWGAAYGANNPETFDFVGDSWPWRR